MEWSKELRMALGVNSWSMPRRWTADGTGLLERSSRRTLESVWGVNWARSAGHGWADSDWPVYRITRVGDSIFQAHRWRGWRRVTEVGGGRQASVNMARNWADWAGARCAEAMSDMACRTSRGARHSSWYDSGKSSGVVSSLA